VALVAFDLVWPSRFRFIRAMPTTTITAPAPRLQMHRGHDEQSSSWIDVAELVLIDCSTVGGHALFKRWLATTEAV